MIERVQVEVARRPMPWGRPNELIVQVMVRVNGREYKYDHRFLPDDFVSVFSEYMHLAERSIREAIRMEQEDGRRAENT